MSSDAYVETVIKTVVMQPRVHKTRPMLLRSTIDLLLFEIDRSYSYGMFIVHRYISMWGFPPRPPEIRSLAKCDLQYLELPAVQMETEKN